LDADPARSIMVGESIADFGAARNAGAKVILVDWGYSAHDVHAMGADAVISSYAEFDAAVARVMASEMAS
ncbi:MAG: HAD hydrolase-like protein, partial [Alphaproteobacteria bacterium]|nr:HAD hydrolase-like protein [Alphaproteobacteria bacterium]